MAGMRWAPERRLFMSRATPSFPSSTHRHRPHPRATGCMGRTGGRSPGPQDLGRSSNAAAMDSGRLQKLTPSSPDRLLGSDLRRSVSSSSCARHHVLRLFSVQRVQDGFSLSEPRPSLFRSDSRGILAAVSEEKTSPGRRVLYRKPELRPSFSMWEALRRQEIPTSLDSSARGSLRQSAPRSVLLLPKRKGMREKGLGSAGDGSGEEEEDEDEGTFMPHERAARSPMTTFSVLEGAGRTLKGRDLRRVRNAVWRKTGFLD